MWPSSGPTLAIGVPTTLPQTLSTCLTPFSSLVQLVTYCYPWYVSNFFLHFGPWSDLLIEFIMAHKTTTGARKKQPVLKASVPKVLAVTQTPSLAQKAASRIHVVSGDKNHPPALGTSASTQTLVTHMGIHAQPVVPAPDKGISHFYWCALLTPPTGDAVSAAMVTLADLIWDLSPEAAARVISLQDEYSTCFVHALSVISFFLFLVELVVTKHQLEETWEIAAHRTSKVGTQIKCPHKVGNVQKAIGFMNKPKL